VRYDKRGVGQSGGRTENATIESYAEDVGHVVNWLRRQRDVDGNRIAVVSHGEGGAVALAAAARLDRIGAVALVAAPGRTGRDYTIERQRQLLGVSEDSDVNKDAKLQLQLRVNEAVVTGKGWEGVPPDVRRQADTAWFRSWLLFDPAAAINRVKQPLLILAGASDREVPPAHADLLEQASRSRRNIAATHTERVVIAGVNHQLVPAASGEPAEDLGAGPSAIAPEVVSALTAWLARAIPAR
jgi:pimeloyl-ACP methyl ester carboxylesterase